MSAPPADLLVSGKFLPEIFQRVSDETATGLSGSHPSKEHVPYLRQWYSAGRIDS